MHLRSRLRALAGLLAGAALLMPLASASAEEEAAAPTSEAAKPPTPMLHGELALALRDAIAMGIENNLDVELDRYTPLIANEEARAAWGAYDPTLNADFNYERAESPNANPLFADPGAAGEVIDILKTKNTRGSSGLKGLIPKLGASYDIGYNGTSVETSSGFPDLSPEYRADLTARASIPLMKGLLWGEPWVQVKVTRILHGQADEDFRRALMDNVLEIERGYWQLVAAAESLRVAEKSLETANALLGQVQAQYEVGVVSRVEVFEADAGVADREFSRIGRENEYRAAQDALIDLVLGELRPNSRLELRPTDAPEPVAYAVDPEQATQQAFAERPELETAREEVERRKILLQFAKNQRLPQLDVVGSYGYNGLSGKTNTEPSFTGAIRDPIPISRSYWATDDDFFGGDGARTWSIGAVLAFPLGNTRANADHRKAALELRRSHTQLRRLEQDIVLEVRGAVRNLGSALQGIEAAERRRLAAAEQQRAEQIRLEHGESTPFDVLLREEDLVDAESQKIFALQVYRNSTVALDRAQGTILRNRNVVVDAARALR